MSVSVVVPTLGTSPRLRESVDAMLRSAALTGPDAEVLVVVNGRPDVPALHGAGSPALRVIALPERNVSRARNAGLDEARHHTVVFGDDGADCDESFCPDLAAALRDPRYPVVTGPVRVPVAGTITAYLNHQRVFDAPPLDGELAGTVTGLCALRRDRVPAHVRYDERRHPDVGEDVAFGHAVRAAGLPIRWLGGLRPGRHRLPDRLPEITDRMIRYGRGAALVHRRGGGGVIAPAEALGLYAYLGSAGYHGYRRFGEVVDPAVRAAFVLYDYLYDLSFLIGYLTSVDPEHPVLVADLDGLAEAWAGLVPPVNPLAAQPVADFTALDEVEPADEPLVGEVRAALSRYAPLRPAAVARPSRPSPDRSLVSARAGSPELARLHAAWRSLRDTGEVTADRLDAAVRAAGHPFRDACAAIERAGIRHRAATAGGVTIPITGGAACSVD